MKTLSNEELKEAITTTIMTYPKAHEDVQSFMLSHLQALLLEQRVRATQSVSIEPMEPAPGRVDFDARVKAQDGPEWVDHDLSDDMPVSRNTTVEVQFEDGQRHGGCAKDFVWTDIDDETNIARYRVWSSSEEKE